MTARKNVPAEQVESAIYLIRGHRVMLSTDLAPPNGVEPQVLVQAVKRNQSRFPAEFMFPLQRQEVAQSRSQPVTLMGKGTDKLPEYPRFAGGDAQLRLIIAMKRNRFAKRYIMTHLPGRIIVDAAVCGGRPHFRGTRIPVYVALEMLTNGEAWDDIHAAYPGLREDDLHDALAFARDLASIPRHAPAAAS